MIEIREAKSSDFQEICELITSKEELFLVYPNGKFPLTISQVNELSNVRKELSVLTKENKVIGFANFYDLVPNKYAFIGNVVIDKKYRSKGFGKQLISYMIDRASSKYELPEIRISVFNENTRAILIYSDFGFSPYEIERKRNISDDIVVLIHMKKS